MSDQQNRTVPASPASDPVNHEGHRTTWDKPTGKPVVIPADKTPPKQK